jgi:hypothetical protein
LLIAIDGSKLDVADTEENTIYFGKQNMVVLMEPKERGLFL